MPMLRIAKIILVNFLLLVVGLIGIDSIFGDNLARKLAGPISP